MRRRVVSFFTLVGVAVAFVGPQGSSVAQSPDASIDVSAPLSVLQQLPAPRVGVRHGTGLFTAKLSGRTLSWRLTFEGLTGRVSAANLHSGAKGQRGPVAIRLCGPCASGAHGTVALRAATARAVVGQNGYVDLSTVKNPGGEIRGQVMPSTATPTSAITTQPAVTSAQATPSTATPTSAITTQPAVTSAHVAPNAVPTIEILSPKAGETISPPTAVRFRVGGFAIGVGAGRIIAFVRGSADNVRVELQLGNETGVATLPANKLLTGRRDLTFALVSADGTLLESSEAQVTISGLTILGGR